MRYPSYRSRKNRAKYFDAAKFPLLAVITYPIVSYAFSHVPKSTQDMILGTSYVVIVMSLGRKYESFRRAIKTRPKEDVADSNDRLT